MPDKEDRLFFRVCLSLISVYNKTVTPMKRKLMQTLGGILLLSAILTGCGISTRPAVSVQTEDAAKTEQTAPAKTEAAVSGDTAADKDEEEEIPMQVYIQAGNRTFRATLESNEAAKAFAEMMQNEPVVLQMHDYAGFEKVGSLGRALPASDVQTTTQAGDIVLYNGNQIVLFYGSNSWRYTRLGRIDDLAGWEEALGSGDVTVTFSIGE